MMAKRQQPNRQTQSRKVTKVKATSIIYKWWSWEKRNFDFNLVIAHMIDCKWLASRASEVTFFEYLLKATYKPHKWNPPRILSWACTHSRGMYNVLLKSFVNIWGEQKKLLFCSPLATWLFKNNICEAWMFRFESHALRLQVDA